METRTGIIDWRMAAEGSKSEGRRAVLCGEDGQEYVLYRADMLPVNDAFFAPYDKQQLTVEGTVEMTGDQCYLCVASLVLSDGTTLSAQPEALRAAGPIFTRKVVADVPVATLRRLPRKLKKQLKKTNNKNR